MTTYFQCLILVMAICPLFAESLPKLTPASHAKFTILRFQIESVRKSLDRDCPDYFITHDLVKREVISSSSPVNTWELRLMEESYLRAKKAYERCLSSLRSTESTTSISEDNPTPPTRSYTTTGSTTTAGRDGSGSERTTPTSTTRFRRSSTIPPQIKCWFYQGGTWDSLHRRCMISTRRPSTTTQSPQTRAPPTEDTGRRTTQRSVSSRTTQSWRYVDGKLVFDDRTSDMPTRGRPGSTVSRVTQRSTRSSYTSTSPDDIITPSPDDIIIESSTASGRGYQLGKDVVIIG